MMQKEFGRFVRFCLVGVANTGVHMLIVVSLAELLHWPPDWANVTAFVCANLFSYAVNSRWTFAVMKGDASRYPRFLAVSLVGLCLSWACVKLAIHLNLHYLIGVAGSVVLVAVSGYVLNRLFVFRHP
ncbi:hypothetical protein GCM10027046_35670 [Uliginosibacterium flavum]|uniref:GtrA family protein n=1 Tax=Uliginosibacterium flavum TaxID=1396831 RepID=A0ABV2TNG2_9RHOO